VQTKTLGLGRTTILAIAVALLVLMVGCGRPARVSRVRRMRVPALAIRPEAVSMRGGGVIRFKVYLIEGMATTLIDPSDVEWSVTRRRGHPGTVRDGVYTASDDVNEFKVAVRGVYRGDRYAGVTSDVALVEIISESGREPTSTPTATGGEEFMEGPSVVGERVFDSSNAYAVQSGPTTPTVFSVGRSRKIVYLVTYHWNRGRGAEPGTIALQDSKGRRHGPWRAKGVRGRRGNPNVYWVVYPNVVLPRGSYAVLDSSPETWSHNRLSNGQGMTIVEVEASEDGEERP